MDIFTSMDISATGLRAQRMRMNVIADNLANANTTRTAKGTPYRRKLVLFAAKENRPRFAHLLANLASESEGVQVVDIIEDQKPFKKTFDPGHPDADTNGTVTLPNVNVVTEMVDMISAARSYESNITVFNTAKNMATKALDIGS